MSVERGSGRDVTNTVQRRGETQASMPRREVKVSARAQEPKREYSKNPTKAAPPKIEKWMAGRQSDYPAMIKERIAQKISEMEGNQEYARFLAKKARSRLIWSLVAIYFVVVFAPAFLYTIFIGLFFFIGGLILLPTLRAKVFDGVFETLATFIAASKLKK